VNRRVVDERRRGKPRDVGPGSQLERFSVRVPGRILFASGEELVSGPGQ
jgi:hypothetical protein